MKLKGFRTLIVNAVGLVVAVAAGAGIVLEPEMVNEALLGIFAIINILLRFKTDTAVGDDK